MMERYVVAMPYSHPAVDFAEILRVLPEVRVSRTGPARRVQVMIDPADLARLRALLPGAARIEPVVVHDHDAPRARAI